MGNVEVVPLCRVEVGFGEMIDTGAGPHGRRIIGETATLAVTGERPRGVPARLLGPGLRVYELADA